MNRTLSFEALTKIFTFIPISKLFIDDKNYLNVMRKE